MISADLKFEPNCLKNVSAHLFALPRPLQPTHFGDDESDSRNRRPIGDAEAFSTFFHNRTTGFFLFGPAFDCMVSAAPGTSIDVYGSVKQEPYAAKSFLKHMAAARPVFGYACADAERVRWNRIIVQQGINAIESWVGRDPQKYVPGLYWWTLLSTALAQQHHVSLTALRDVALEHVEIKGGQNLFKFYEKPDGWTSAPRVDALRLSQPGIFDVEKVRPLVAATKTFLELSAVTRAWP